MKKHLAPRVIDLTSPALSPVFARLLADLDRAEAAWSKINSKRDDAYARAVKGGDKKLVSSLNSGGGSHPLSRATDAAWDEVEKAETAIVRHRARNYADVVVKFRLDSLLGGQPMASASRLYASAVADAERLTEKGGVA
jgi:hypothetical protein